MALDFIRIRGARTHNLRTSISTAPREADRHHGPVGFRQVLAGFRHDLREGQRRYVESLSAYARQFSA
jgi:excinuclease ABC subunit A